MKRIITMVIICVVGMFPLNGRVSASENIDDLNIAKEKLRSLREAYKEYIEAAKNLHEVVEQAKRDIPLLGPTEKALRDNKEFTNLGLANERQKYDQYLKYSKDPNETKKIFGECRMVFGAMELAAALNDSNQERVLKLPMLFFFHKLSSAGSDRKTEFVESLKKSSLTLFDIDEPNDNVLWHNLKRMNYERATNLKTKQQELIEAKKVPQWLANYAGRADFAQFAFEAYECALFLLSPEEVRQAEIRLIKAGNNLSDIYPGWFSMHHLLDDQKSSANEALVEEAQEHLRIWPVQYISPSELKN